MKISLATGAAILVFAFAPIMPAASMPLTPMTSSVTQAGADTLVVRYGGGGRYYGYGRGGGRGHHYGWSRGRHRGWH
jgi:hypothetical protein